jgi:hypothetical protein
MKTLIQTLMMALTAVTTVVVATQPAAACGATQHWTNAPCCSETVKEFCRVR